MACYVFLSVQEALYITVIWIISCVISYFSWRIFIKIAGIEIAFSASSFSIDKLLSAFFGGATGYRKPVVSGYFQKFLFESTGGYLFPTPYVFWLVLFLGLSYILYRLTNNRNQKQRTFVFVLGVSVGTTIYIVYQLFAYLFLLSEYDALLIASFSRYLGTWFVAIISSVIFLNITRLLESEKSNQRILIGISAISIGCILTVNPMKFAARTVLSEIGQRGMERLFIEYYSVTPTVQEVLTDSDKLFIVSYEAPFSLDLSRYKMRYDLYPAKVASRDSFRYYRLPDTVLPEDANKDNFTFASLEEWMGIILSENCTHVYLNEVDELFAEQYGNAFENRTIIKNHALYNVVPYDDTFVLTLAST